MTRTSLVLAALATALVGSLAAMPAQAQRVFVAAQGTDGNPCTFAAPCRTFQHAHDTVAAGGEIDVLDPAGYGTLTITKAISIQGHGFAGISVGEGRTGVLVNAGEADAVSLNGLLIDGGGQGDIGIRFSRGMSLVVANCLVRNMQDVGLHLDSHGASPESLAVSNSYFIQNQTAGISAATFSSGAVTIAVERTGLFGNTFGFGVQIGAGNGPIEAAVSDSVAANSSVAGFFVGSAPGLTPANLTLTRVTSIGNPVGVRAGTNGVLRLAQSTVTGNQTGYSVQGGTVASYGDNYLSGNGNNDGVLAQISRQ
jgi:hypothetical protein